MDLSKNSFYFLLKSLLKNLSKNKVLMFFLFLPILQNSQASGSFTNRILESSFANRILGSSLTENSVTWRYVFKISTFEPSTEKHFVCTAVLVRWNALLTAGHCLKNDRVVRKIRLFKGSLVHKTISLFSDDVEHIVHPEYKKTGMKRYDVGLVVLSNVDFPAGYYPATWNSNRHFNNWNNLEGKYAYIVGASHNGIGTIGYAKGIISKSNHSGVWVTGDQSNGTCKGDSGGGVFAYFDGRPVLIGIHATRLPGQKNTCNPGGYNVAFSPDIREWVLDNS